MKLPALAKCDQLYVYSIVHSAGTVKSRVCFMPDPATRKSAGAGVGFGVDVGFGVGGAAVGAVVGASVADVGVAEAAVAGTVDNAGFVGGASAPITMSATRSAPTPPIHHHFLAILRRGGPGGGGGGELGQEGGCRSFTLFVLPSASSPRSSGRLTDVTLWCEAFH